MSKHRELQLAEVKPLAVELSESVHEVLCRIRVAKDELAPPSTAPIAFVHIPKTAGGTAKNMLAAAYSRTGLRDAGNYMVRPERAVSKLNTYAGRWEDWHRKGGRVTVGHVPYGLFRRYLPASTRYITFLREPGARVLSHYYRHVFAKDPRVEKVVRRPERAPNHRDRSEAPRVAIGLLREALVEKRLPELTNLATRFLCGHPSLLGELPASALDDAKENLREFAFVGLQERFEESIVLLQRMLELDLIPYESRHVRIGSPALAEIPAEARALIAEHNGLDAELYAFARELFDDAVTSSGEGLAADAARLRAVSQAANDDALRHAREWLDRELPVGTVKPKAALLAAAQEAGVSGAALKHVSQLGITKEGRNGEVLWTRIEEV
jgi:hypothetical protein